MRPDFAAYLDLGQFCDLTCCDLSPSVKRTRIHLPFCVALVSFTSYLPLVTRLLPSDLCSPCCLAQGGTPTPGTSLTWYVLDHLFDHCLYLHKMWAPWKQGLGPLCSRQHLKCLKYAQHRRDVQKLMVVWTAPGDLDFSPYFKTEKKKSQPWESEKWSLSSLSLQPVLQQHF